MFVSKAFPGPIMLSHQPGLPFSALTPAACASPEKACPIKIAFDFPPRSTRPRSQKPLRRRPGADPSAPAFQSTPSKLKITGVRLVLAPSQRKPTPTLHARPRLLVHRQTWRSQNPDVHLSEVQGRRARCFCPAGKDGRFFTVEIATDKGVKGYGNGGAGGGMVVMEHLSKLLLNQDPFNVERIWDIMWRSTMYYGRTGVVINAISGVDLALWDLIGNALGMPVYKLLGGETKPRIPAYCTGNDIEQHLEAGFQRLKLAIPHGPADGKEGMRKNLELVKRTRELLGPDGDIMLDCWMAWTERYTIEMAEMLEPYRVYWMEECLQPHDYAGFGRLNAAIKSTRIATGEHEYTRYGFRQLLEHHGASIWQPDINWCGGLTETAAHRRAGRGLRHSGDPARRRPKSAPLHHGDHQRPLGRTLHAPARRSAGSVPAFRRGLPDHARPRRHLHASERAPRPRLGSRCQLSFQLSALSGQLGSAPEPAES